MVVSEPAKEKGFCPHAGNNIVKVTGLIEKGSFTVVQNFLECIIYEVG